MILLTAGALTDPQLPERASNVYTIDARLGGIDRVASAGWPPPNKNPGYAVGLKLRRAEGREFEPRPGQ